MRGQGEYIATVVLVMIIMLIASLAINWARYIENTGKIQVANLMRNKEKLVVIWPYENDRDRILVVNQWDGASEIEGVLIFANQTLFRTIESNNTYLSVGGIKILSLRDLGFNIDNLSDIKRICLVTIYSNIFCNEYIPMKTIIPQNIELEVVSSPLKVYVSSTVIVSPIAVTGFITGSSDRPLIDVVSPYLPSIPVALVLSDGFGVYSASAGKKNFTVVVNYSNGNPNVVSAYLDGENYTWSNTGIVSDYFLVVDGVPFRILSGYNGTAIYRADIYYAYVSSNKSVARVYSLSYPIKLDPLDSQTFIKVMKEALIPANRVEGGQAYKMVLGSPVVLANYSLSGGSLKLQTILAPRSAKFFANYKGCYQFYIDASDIDLSRQDIYLTREILTVPVIQAQPSNTTKGVTIYGIWRDLVKNDLGTRNFTLIPLGQGVYGNVIELEYLRIVPVIKYSYVTMTTHNYGFLTTTTLATITSVDTNPLDDVRLNPSQYRFEVDPLQWIIYDNNNHVAKVITFRFIAPAMPDPDRIAGYIFDYAGQMPQTYTALGVMWRDTFTTARTTVCTQNIYTVLPQASAISVTYTTNGPIRAPWASMLFINGMGLVWLDYEGYCVSERTGCVVVLYKYPYNMTRICPTTTTTTTTRTITTTIPTTTTELDYDFILAQRALTEDEPWGAVVIYIVIGPSLGIYRVELIAKKLELMTVNGTLTWVTVTTISTTTYVDAYSSHTLGYMEAGKYQIWDVVAIFNGNITRPGSVKNFRDYPTTQTIYVTNMYPLSVVIQMSTPIQHPYTYLGFQHSDEYLAFVTLIVLAMIFRKIWYNIEI